MLQFLFNSYRNIPSEEVKQKEKELRTTAFNPADPMIILYNQIEKIRKMAEAANIAYTENQILDIGLTVIQNTRDFEKALGDWENLLTTDKMWVRFKTNFTASQQQLKEIQAPTMQQAGYHHTNHLSQQLRNDMQHRDNDIMSILHTAMDSNLVTPPSRFRPLHTHPTTSPAERDARRHDST